MRHAIVPLIFVLFIGLAGTAGAQTAGDETRGFGFARDICSQCHAVRRGQISSSNTAAPTFQTIANVPGMTELALRAALRTSHPIMPNLILTDEQLSDVIAYILSLQVDR